MSVCAELVEKPRFDYSSLAASHRRAIETEADAIRGLLRRTAESIVQIGLRLQIVHDLLGRNQFQNWLSAEFAWSQPTASRYMRVAALFSEVACIKQFQPSALYLLAQKRVDDSAREAAIARAEAGQSVTKLTVEQILADSKRLMAPGERPLPMKIRNYVARITKDVEQDSLDDVAETLIHVAQELKERQSAVAME